MPTSAWLTASMRSLANLRYASIVGSGFSMSHQSGKPGSSICNTKPAATTARYSSRKASAKANRNSSSVLQYSLKIKWSSQPGASTATNASSTLAPERAIRMLIEGTDPFAAKPDARLVKLLIRARQFNATLLDGDGTGQAGRGEPILLHAARPPQLS